MIQSVNSLSSSSIALLFGVSRNEPSASVAGAVKPLPGEISGSFDASLRIGNAIGNIIAIAARMNDANDAVKAFENLQIYGANGTYTRQENSDKSVTESFTGTATQISSLAIYDTRGEYIKQTDAKGNTAETFTGTGLGMPQTDFEKHVIEQMTKSAKEHAAYSASANAYLDATRNGTLQTYDMSTMGVTSTITTWKNNYSSGIDWETKGLVEFRENNMVMKDGQMYDKATGKYAGYSQNGTNFTYYIW